MKKYILDLKVKDNTRIHADYSLIKLTADATLPEMVAGQFVQIRVDGSATTFLRRPISINRLVKQSNELWLLIRAVGDGTRRMAEYKVGDTVNVILPLGNGFSMPTAKSGISGSYSPTLSSISAFSGSGYYTPTAKSGFISTDFHTATAKSVSKEAEDAAIILNNKLTEAESCAVTCNHQLSNAGLLLAGGGVGTAPLLFWGETLKSVGYEPVFLLGGRTSADILQKELFETVGATFYTTEDGSAGEKGLVTDHTLLRQRAFDRIYACGPKPMMQAIASYARKHEIECEVSLENTMACGIGACLCCVEKTINGNVCACTEGPVFNIKQLTWQI